MSEDNYKNRYKTRLLGAMAIYAIFSMCALAFALSRPRVDILTNDGSVPPETVTVTEYIYVFGESDTQPYTEGTSTEEQIYIIREHMGKIGIFLPDGTLYDTVDAYVKTLPEADRRLLEEGFEVVGKHALGEIIQDYSS